MTFTSDIRRADDISRKKHTASFMRLKGVFVCTDEFAVGGFITMRVIDGVQSWGGAIGVIWGISLRLH